MSAKGNTARAAQGPSFAYLCALALALPVVGCSAGGAVEGRPGGGTGVPSTPMAGTASGPLIPVEEVQQSTAPTVTGVTPAAVIPSTDSPAVAMQTEGGCGAEVTAPAPSKAIDIIWIVDASVSMLDEQQRIAENLTRFADTITAADLDVHILMLTTAATIPVVCVPPSTDPAANTALNGDPRYFFIETLVDSNNPLDIAISQFSRYQMYLRPEATTHFVFVSDDESRYGGLLDPGQRSAAFQGEMTGLLGHTFYSHTISSPGPTPCIPALCTPPMSTGFVCDIVAAICTTSSPGLSYWQLAEDTGGLAASICEGDWSAIFNPLTEAIVSTAPLPCSYTIPPAPLGMELNKDKVNVSFSPTGGEKVTWPRAGTVQDCVDNLAWYFDDDSGRPKEVKLCPAACTLAELGGTLDLSFGCEAQILE